MLQCLLNNEKVKAAHGVPLIAPLVITPVIAAVSVAEVIVGIALTILLGTAAFATSSKCLAKKAASNSEMTLLAIHCIAFCLANVITVGYLGYTYKNLTEHITKFGLQNA